MCQALGEMLGIQNKDESGLAIQCETNHKQKIPIHHGSAVANKKEERLNA